MNSTKLRLLLRFFSGTAAAWRLTRVSTNTIPTTWEALESAVYQEFVPFNTVIRSRDKLRRLDQRTSVSKYLSEFRNIVLTIPDMNEREQVDRFCQGLKPQIPLEVLKSGARIIIDASRIALNIDSALWGTGMYNIQKPSFSGPCPMEIWNIKQKMKIF